MEFLDLPLCYENGAFHRADPEKAIYRYVELFFETPSNEVDPGLNFGVDMQKLSWASAHEVVRFKVDEFNRVHRGRMALLIEGVRAVGGRTQVRLSLRFAGRRYSVSVEE